MSLLIDELMLECKRKGIKITQKDLAKSRRDWADRYP